VQTTGSSCKNPSNPAPPRLQVQFSPDGRWVVSASFDKALKLWDGVRGTFVATLRGHVGPIYQVAWSADSRLLVSASKDSTLKARAAPAPPRLRPRRSPAAGVTGSQGMLVPRTHYEPGPTCRGPSPLHLCLHRGASFRARAGQKAGACARPSAPSRARQQAAVQKQPTGPR